VWPGGRRSDDPGTGCACEVDWREEVGPAHGAAGEEQVDQDDDREEDRADLGDDDSCPAKVRTLGHRGPL
jgi:hypothetical protein